MNAKFKSHIDRLKADMATDKKKTAILGGLSLVLLIAVGRLLLPGDDTATVAANPNVVSSASALPITDNSLIPKPAMTVGPGTPPVAVVPRRIEASVPSPTKGSSTKKTASSVPVIARPSKAPTVNPDVVSSLPEVPMRDPFDATGWRRRFGAAQVATTESGQSSNALSFFSDWANRMVSYQTEQAQLAQQLDEELAELELRSTLTGASKSAYISGQLVKEGDEITGFSVVRIEPGQVVLSKYGIQRRLSVP